MSLISSFRLGPVQLLLPLMMMIMMMADSISSDYHTCLCITQSDLHI